jgi:hypothetical protein
MTILNYLNALTQIIKETLIQKKYIQNFLLPYLRDLEEKYEGRFSDEQRKKIIHYYGLFIPVFLCSSYKAICGKVLTDEERKRATLLGILTPIGDDLTDIEGLDNTSLYVLTTEPWKYHATSFATQVAKEIQNYLLSTVPNKSAYMAASKEVLEIQLATKAQTSSHISKEELERITYNKGGFSVILYHQCLDSIAEAQMKETLFYIGSLFQLGNDIFDIYKDVRDRIYTIPNTCNDFKELQKNIEDRIREQNRIIMNLPFSESRKFIFCIIMNTINAASMVAVRNFINLEKMHHGKIDWHQCTRNEMIVDMEKPINLLKRLYFIWKLPRLFPK